MSMVVLGVMALSMVVLGVMAIFIATLGVVAKAERVGNINGNLGPLALAKAMLFLGWLGRSRACA